MWFVIAHWVITFDLSLVLCLFLTLPFFDCAEVDVVCRIMSFDFVDVWLKLSFHFFLVLVWISFGDCCLVRLYFYMCLLYFCNLTAVFFFYCSLCSLSTFLPIKTTTTTNQFSDKNLFPLYVSHPIMLSSFIWHCTSSWNWNKTVEMHMSCIISDLFLEDSWHNVEIIATLHYLILCMGSYSALHSTEKLTKKLIK